MAIGRGDGNRLTCRSTQSSLQVNILKKEPCVSQVLDEGCMTYLVRSILGYAAMEEAPSFIVSLVDPRLKSEATLANGAT